MADGSHIEWTDATWNPVTGCSVVSPGCTNCYAMKLAGTRLRDHPSRVGLTAPSKAGPVWTGEVRFNEGWLDQPLRWKRGRRIFVCAHGDLFHENVPDEWIDRVFAVMALAPQHSFQVLTKRSARMREHVSQLDDYLLAETREYRHAAYRVDCGDDPNGSAGWHAETAGFQDAIAIVDRTLGRGEPLPNVWLGVSVEDQARAGERIPDLLATPAAVRFLSCEPLLGPIDLTRVRRFPPGVADNEYLNSIEGKVWTDQSGLPNPDPRWAYPGTPFSDGDCRIDWVIAGGESGQGARPMHPDWPRALRDQCAAAAVPYFFKQWGEYARVGDQPGVDHLPDDADALTRVGKKAAGRLLDGETHDGFPGG